MTESNHSPRDVAFDALREMYSEAIPSADFDEIYENAEEQPDDWYQRHYLHEERQSEIVDRHCEENNLSDDERRAVVMTAILDLGPTSTPRVIVHGE